MIRGPSATGPLALLSPIHAHEAGPSGGDRDEHEDGCSTAHGIRRQVPRADDVQARRDGGDHAGLVRERSRATPGRDRPGVVQGQADPARADGERDALLGARTPVGGPGPGTRGDPVRR